MEELERRLKAKVDYVNHNLNTQLLSIYQSTEQAEADEDLAKTVLLRYGIRLLYLDQPSGVSTAD